MARAHLDAVRGHFEPPVPTSRQPDGTWLHAEVGELRSCDGDERVVCHVCGDALAHLSSAHLSGHGLTLAGYRERFGLNRKQPLMSPAMQEQRRREGHRRLQLDSVRVGLAQGQDMARSGELVRLGQLAQAPGTASAQRRSAVSRSLAATRARQAETAAARRHERAVELGFADVPEFLRAQQAAGLTPWAMARLLRCGNAKTIRRLLAEAALQS